MEKKSRAFFFFFFVASFSTLARSLVVTNRILSLLLPLRAAQLDLFFPTMRRAATFLLSRASSSASSSSSSSRALLLSGERGRNDVVAAIGGGACSTSSSSTFLPLFSQSNQHLLHRGQRRSFAIPCNLKLGAVPPPPLVVRYARGGADAFIELADELEEAVPGLMVEGREDEEGGEGDENKGNGNVRESPITEVLAPGGKTLLAATRGRPVLARDVLEALGKWQQEQEQEQQKKR
jgi:hypothetical protein